jgi:FKBP-type peptidyl-prolyl cis-trans isomerase
MGERARRDGEAFLAEFSARPGVTTTESGLRYRVIRQGDGPSPTIENDVVVHYEGMLPDSTVFDSSYRRGEPVRFPVTGVIPGFTEALQLMRVGGQYEIVLPPDLAYGDSPQGPGGPGSTLIFTVELLEVLPAHGG